MNDIPEVSCKKCFKTLGRIAPHYYVDDQTVVCGRCVVFYELMTEVKDIYTRRQFADLKRSKI